MSVAPSCQITLLVTPNFFGDQKSAEPAHFKAVEQAEMFCCLATGSLLERFSAAITKPGRGFFL